ncbi:RNA polymerase factor sigma-54 [Thiohalorhabdus methylotrophus]|uniref:RNA polymerase sigma-54 factor n=1 Tax=Thiohalorhabdus methylotrophus TaxID=3242694 RepID=A0ABV4TUF4_9GAMM
MKPALELKVSQQLKMTPQLRQAIHLLQLSRLELDQEIRETLEENPLLEEVTPGNEEEFEAEADSEPYSSLEVADRTSEPEKATSDHGPEDTVDTDWDAGVAPDSPALSGSGSGTGEEDELPGFEARNSAPETLGDHLLWQIHMAPLSEGDRAIAEALVSGVSDEGYQTATLAEVAEALEVPEEDVHAVHVWVMHLDPVGVGARDLAECLGAQLDLLDKDTPGLATAREVVRHHLEALGKHDLKGIRKAVGVEEEELDTAVALIRTLNPRPGSVIGGEAAPTVLPDVLVYHRGGRWHVELNAEAIPRLRINAAYSDLVRGNGADQEARKYVRDHLQQARWFIKSLASRNETLLKVATAIVERQQGFLEHGPTAMRPMVLRDIADAVELHESTVSRVTTQKYMHTPQGVFELKYFFSSQLGTTDGEGVSATAIRAMLQRLVDEEEPGKPYSDAKLAEILEEQGFQVARRTVVKYRQALGIPSSSQRRRMMRR